MPASTSTATTSNSKAPGTRASRRFDLLAQINEPGRRKALFMAFVPLWRTINADGAAGSPYRRLIGMAAAEAGRHGSEIDAAARTLGVSSTSVEDWLTRILDAWRVASGDDPIEPWDYRYAGGGAERALGDLVPREALQALSARYYADLGAELASMGVLYDLEPRPGKAPFAYADFVSRGRYVGGAWRPTVTRVSANYSRGGLGVLNELVHEDGHVVHLMAVRTRPAFMDWGDTLFVEAFADVVSWNTYDPAWQRKYLGRSAPQNVSLRSLYSSVMLDVAWALFELRMLRDPPADPNAVWTEITSRYLHIVPHPEAALVGGAGAARQLTGLHGQLRSRRRAHRGSARAHRGAARTRSRPAIRAGTAGSRRGCCSSGLARDTATLLREFLGRPVSPDALIADIARISDE